MSKQIEEKEVVEEKEEQDLRGSLVSVLFLGVFLILSWAGVWILYLVR